MFEQSSPINKAIQVIDQNISTIASQSNNSSITFIFMILCLFINSTYQKVVCRDLFSDEFSNTWYAYDNQYNSQNQFQSENCDSYKAIFIRQFSSQYLIYKTIELSPHYQLTLDLKFMRLDNDNQRVFIIYIDNQIEHEQIYSNANQSAGTCSSSSYENYLIFPISITIQHSISSVTVALLATNQYWGITEFQLSINECLIGCDSCNSFGCTNQELVLQLFNLIEFSNINYEDGWQIGDITINKCLGFNYIVSRGSDLIKVFELDLHYGISFQLKLLIFNSQSTQIHIFIDESLVLTTEYVQKVLKTNSQICDYIDIQEINVIQYQHQNQRLKIHVKVDLQTNFSTITSYIGMRDFKLFFSNKGCMDNDIVPFNGCFFNNYDCIQGCENCIKGICYECLIGWEFIEQFNSCIPLCGDAIITYDEECDDGNQFIFDGCHQCKYSCPKDCKLCQFGKCLMCEKNYLVLESQCQYIPDNIGLAFMEREWFILFIDQEYQQNILQLRNQLSNIDYKNKNYLGYFEQIYLNCKVFGYEHNQSKFLQLYNCKVEYFGKCLECQDEYELDFHKKQCIPKCQDGIILSQEICDDGNRIQFDGCYKCQQSCQIECLYCSNNQCYKCQEGWQLKDYQCIQICGDGLLANISNEQCDDLDDLNCINCQYQCDNDCLVCDKFKNCEFCSYPFQIKDGKCLPICGDKIITPIFEECDDGNDIPYDGCYECQFQCSLGCIQCKENNHCEQCDNLYFILDTQTFKCQYLYQNIDSELKQNDTNLFTVQCKENQMFINNQCVNQCGNGILNSQFEQCDDGNNIGGDGCSAFCFEEDSFLCINQENSLSICTFIQKPDFNLILLSDKNNQTKMLELSFTQNVYKFCQFPFENIVEIIILPQTESKFTIVPNINITSQLNNPSYYIYIEFLKSVAEPILKIDIQKFCIFNQFDLDLTTNTKQIALGTPFLLSEDNQKKVTSVIKMNDAVIYSTASIAGILLLTGNYIVFFNLLDLLQSLSYIKYMQYNFPPHLSQFLETYTKISLQPILDILKVNEIIAKLNGGTLPSQGQKSKQPQYTNAMNQFYLVNAKGCFFSYLASLLTYFICCLISSIQVQQWLRKRYEKNSNSIIVLRRILIFQKKILSKCSKLKNNYFSSGVYQLFYSTLHQLAFSTLLQFPQYTFNSIFEIINSVIALASLLFIIQILFRLLSITTSKIQDKQKWQYFFQDTKTEFWAGNFKSFQIYRTVYYITIIVKFIKYPEAQSILLSMQSFFYIMYLIFFRPIKSNFDLAKLLCREVVFLIITGSFLVYSLELNEDQFLFYGWLHIALFCFIMIFTLIVDILEQGIQAYSNHLKKIEKQRKLQILLYYDNPIQKFVMMDNQDLKKKL